MKQALVVLGLLALLAGGVALALGVFYVARDPAGVECCQP